MSRAIATTSVYEAERTKYGRMWRDVPAYRTMSPGEGLVGPFLGIAGAKPGARVVDVGCGTGRAGLQLSRLLMHVLLVDATREALDPDVDAVLLACEQAPTPPWSLQFTEACVWDRWPVGVDRDYAFCTDVLEHVPTEFTMLVVQRCLEAAPRAFFHINFDPDAFGATIGEPLHLTVQPFVWWRDRLADLGLLTEARDLLGSGLFLLERA